MEGKALDFKIGHVLIQVDHLESAICQFQNMGFKVTPGGLPGKYHNAMIYLRDGSFLELFSTEYGSAVTLLMHTLVKLMGIFDRPYADRFALYLPGNHGLRDYALDSSSSYYFKENIKTLHKNGLLLSKARTKKRTDLHGIKLTWQLCAPHSTSLPFLMSEYNPKPTINKDDRNHPNGVIGIKELHLMTNQWEKVYREYVLLLGMKPNINKNGKRRSCRFQIQETVICLREDEKNALKQLVLYHDGTSGDKFDELPTFLTVDTSLV